jgi:hypothetical protein
MNRDVLGTLDDGESKKDALLDKVLAKYGKGVSPTTDQAFKRDIRQALHFDCEVAGLVHPNYEPAFEEEGEEEEAEGGGSGGTGAGGGSASGGGGGCSAGAGAGAGSGRHLSF